MHTSSMKFFIKFCFSIENDKLMIHFIKKNVKKNIHFKWVFLILFLNLATSSIYKGYPRPLTTNLQSYSINENDQLIFNHTAEMKMITSIP